MQRRIQGMKKWEIYFPLSTPCGLSDASFGLIFSVLCLHDTNFQIEIIVIKRDMINKKLFIATKIT